MGTGHLKKKKKKVIQKFKKDENFELNLDSESSNCKWNKFKFQNLIIKLFGKENSSLFWYIFNLVYSFNDLSLFFNFFDLSLL